MFQQCMIQYANYGNYIPIEHQIQAQFADPRMLQLFGFYIVFSLAMGALCNYEHSKGLSFARATAIVFLLNEIEEVLYYQQKVENMGYESKFDKHDLNTRIEMIASFFPSTFIPYEILQVQRLAFYFIFNVACAMSQIFFNSREQEDLIEATTLEENQKKISDYLKDIYKNQLHEDFTRKPFGSNSIQMKNVYNTIKAELALELQVVEHGISKTRARITKWC